MSAVKESRPTPRVIETPRRMGPRVRGDDSRMGWRDWIDLTGCCANKKPGLATGLFISQILEPFQADQPELERSNLPNLARL